MTSAGGDTEKAGVRESSEQTQRFPSGQRSRLVCVGGCDLCLHGNPQGMTMKIRFMKKLTGNDNFSPSNGGTVSGKKYVSHMNKIFSRLHFGYVCFASGGCSSN